MHLTREDGSVTEEDFYESMGKEDTEQMDYFFKVRKNDCLRKKRKRKGKEKEKKRNERYIYIYI